MYSRLALEAGVPSVSASEMLDYSCSSICRFSSNFLIDSVRFSVLMSYHLWIKSSFLIESVKKKKKSTTSNWGDEQNILQLLLFYINMCACAPCACSARGHQKMVLDHWNWIHGWSWAVVWMLGTKSWSSVGAASAVSTAQSSPARYRFLMLWFAPSPVHILSLLRQLFVRIVPPPFQLAGCPLPNHTFWKPVSVSVRQPGILDSAFFLSGAFSDCYFSWDLLTQRQMVACHLKTLQGRLDAGALSTGPGQQEKRWQATMTVLWGSLLVIFGASWKAHSSYPVMFT